MHLDSDEPQLAADLLHRCRLIIDLLREQIVILETMAPADYHVLRTTSLGRGSGQESPGFKMLLDVGKRLWPRFQDLLAALASPSSRSSARRASITSSSVSCRPCWTTTKPS